MNSIGLVWVFSQKVKCAWTGTLKNPTKSPWRWEPDSRPNFFSPPAHLCAVTYITEMSLHVTLSNKSHFILYILLLLC